MKNVFVTFILGCVSLVSWSNGYAQSKLTGIVVPAQVIELAPAVAGKVKSISVAPGQTVMAQTLLLELDTTYLRSALKAAKSQEALKKAELEEAQRSYERDTTLYEEGSLSTVELDQTNLTMLRASSAYEQSVAHRLLVSGRLDSAKVFAPFAGRILSQDFAPGMWLQPSANPRQVMVFASSKLMVLVSVPASNGQSIALGSEIGIVTPNGAIEGRVANMITDIKSNRIELQILTDNALPSVGSQVEVSL